MDRIGSEAMSLRLDRLERENRRLRRIGMASAVGAILLLLCGARQDDAAKGERVFITDEARGAGIALGASKDGEPVLSFRRTIDGKAYSMNLRMFVAGDGVPVLIFEDQAGITRYKIPR